MDLAAAITRLRKFSETWNDDDVVDEESGLTGADIRLVVEHVWEPAVPTAPE
jgi:hypothetical protein